jgi:hypothetical protein
MIAVIVVVVAVAGFVPVNHVTAFQNTKQIDFDWWKGYPTISCYYYQYYY